MRDILKDYRIFKIDAKQSRSKEFFKNLLEYRHYLMDKFKQSVRTPEQFECLLCHHRRGQEFLNYRDYPLFECLNCGLVSPNIDLALVDEEEVYDNAAASADVKREILDTYDYRKKNYAPERLGYILEKTKIPEQEVRLLDVGCGPGYLLEFMQERGINYKGLELADFLVGICRERGLNVEKSVLTNEPNAHYNIITMFDVLEHLRDPIAMFNDLNRKLMRGGYVLAYTPNIHAVSFVLMGGLQNNLYPYVHLGFFDRTSLAYLADKTGFEICSIDYYGLDIIDYLCLKVYDDGVDYLENLKDCIPVLQAVLDKQKISNHQRILFRKK